MKITYLGQAGFLLETSAKTILIDPYLSDSVAKVEPRNKRRISVDNKYLNLRPDIIVCTHNHLDHLDKETLRHYVDNEREITFLSPYSGWQVLREFGGKNNYVMFNSGTEWTESNIRFKAVKAEHSDPYAIGVIVYSENKSYYFTGDTLFNGQVIENLRKEEFEAVFLPVNGKGNNMNFAEAKRFAESINTKKVVPIHIGLFDDLTAEAWDCPNKVVPQIYKEVCL